MKVSLKTVVASAMLLAIVAIDSIQAEYDVDAFCTLVKNGERLASIDDCATYYTCYNGKSTKSSCPSGQSFDKNVGSCRPQSDVHCYIGNEQPCMGKSDEFVPVVNTCDRYIYCENNVEKGRGQCPNGLVFKQGTCDYGKCSENMNGGGDQGLQSACQVMPNKQFFGSSFNCKAWFVCVNGDLVPGLCDDGFVFNPYIGRCDFPSSYPCTHVSGKPIIPDDTPETKCSPNQNGQKKPDPVKCSMYQQCDGNYWKSKTCPLNEFYDEGNKKCMNRQKATPVKTCSRCEYTRHQFVNAVDPECRGYQICENGVKEGANKCPVDHYFDEWSQGCINDANGAERYAQNNGACKPDGNNGNNDCAKTCSALSNDKCVPQGDCECGIDDDKCSECKDGVDQGKCVHNNDCAATCSALSNDKCVPQDGCECGIDDDKCSECKDGVDQGKCVHKVDCKVDCALLAANKCEDTDDCKCSMGDDGKCAETIDCATECQNLDANNCNLAGCTCGIHDGHCEDCSDDSCNGCICEGAQPECITPPCACYVDKDGDCIYCEFDIDEDEPSEPTCKADPNAK